jgi:hypothetical protein
MDVVAGCATRRPPIPPAYGRFGASAVDLHLRGPSASPLGLCAAPKHPTAGHAQQRAVPQHTRAHAAGQLATHAIWPAEVSPSMPSRMPSPSKRRAESSSIFFPLHRRSNTLRHGLTTGAGRTPPRGRPAPLGLLFSFLAPPSAPLHRRRPARPSHRRSPAGTADARGRAMPPAADGAVLGPATALQPSKTVSSSPCRPLRPSPPAAGPEFRPPARADRPRDYIALIRFFSGFPVKDSRDPVVKVTFRVTAATSKNC